MSIKHDGTFQLFYKEGWACLTVFPPEKGGRPVYVENVSGRIQLLGIPSVRQQIIRDIIEKAEGLPSKLIQWPDGEKLGPEITTSISEDNMSASVTITSERQGGEPLSEEKLIKALKEAGVVFGLQEEALASILRRKIYGQPVLIAHGRPPVDEETARIEYLFETDRGKPFRELDYERIDLKELNFIQNRDEGDILARLLAPITPEDGMDVRGNPLPARTGGADSALKAGEGTLLSADGREITAQVTGNVKLTTTGVIIEPLVTVENIDYSNGNMDFKGAIDVQGRIADGFTVKTDGDIQIGKSVSKINITSGGDMVLKAGISGNDEGIITCGGDLYAKYIENATIYCKGNIYVEEAIMHSNVMGEKDIILSGKRAEIFGGQMAAGGSLKCKKLGSINEPQTEVHLGLSLADYKKQEALEEKIKITNSEIDKTDLQIRQIKAAIKKGGAAETPLEIPQDKLSTALTQLQDKSVKLNTQVSEGLKDLHEMKREQKIDENAHLTVEQQIFGNVSVFFGSHRWVSSGKATSKTVLMVKKGKLLEKGSE
ncbi:MAG: DUF342 domain-containing protein [Spirochaetales bacterium]|nr:DUF342 domain-containing protein [Spirochaetales bacterium]